MWPEYSVAKVGLFLMKKLSFYVDKIRTRRHLLDTAMSLKKGEFNTPSVLQFLKRNGGSNFLQNRRLKVVVFADKQRFLSVAICQQSLSRSSYLKSKKPTTMSNKLIGYRLCVCASGSLITDILNC